MTCCGRVSCSATTRVCPAVPPHVCAPQRHHTCVPCATTRVCTAPRSAQHLAGVGAVCSHSRPPHGHTVPAWRRAHRWAAAGQRHAHAGGGRGARHTRRGAEACLRSHAGACERGMPQWQPPNTPLFRHHVPPRHARVPLLPAAVARLRRRRSHECGSVDWGPCGGQQRLPARTRAGCAGR
jgi:hypothetical protein